GGFGSSGAGDGGDAEGYGAVKRPHAISWPVFIGATAILALFTAITIATHLSSFLSVVTSVVAGFGISSANRRIASAMARNASGAEHVGRGDEGEGEMEEGEGGEARDGRSRAREKEEAAALREHVVAERTAERAAAAAAT
ncbi:hypothetical protein Vretifemale_3989, partial [Volvox reticuliferus]